MRVGFLKLAVLIGIFSWAAMLSLEAQMRQDQDTVIRDALRDSQPTYLLLLCEYNAGTSCTDIPRKQ